MSHAANDHMGSGDVNIFMIHIFEYKIVNNNLAYIYYRRDFS